MKVSKYCLPIGTQSGPKYRKLRRKLKQIRRNSLRNSRRNILMPLFEEGAKINIVGERTQFTVIGGWS